MSKLFQNKLLKTIYIIINVLLFIQTSYFWWEEGKYVSQYTYEYADNMCCLYCFILVVNVVVVGMVYLHIIEKEEEKEQKVVVKQSDVTFENGKHWYE